MAQNRLDKGKPITKRIFSFEQIERQLTFREQDGFQCLYHNDY